VPDLDRMADYVEEELATLLALVAADPALGNEPGSRRVRRVKQTASKPPRSR
jgi:hypothetical protein